MPEKPAEPESEEPVAEVKKLNVEKWMLPLGIAGLVAWIIFSPFKTDSPILNESKKKAVEIARNELHTRYNLNLDEWTILTSVADNVDIRDIFVWQEGGEQTYRRNAKHVAGSSLLEYTTG